VLFPGQFSGLDELMWEIVAIITVTYGLFSFLKRHMAMRRQFKEYVENDFSKQEGWHATKKVQALVSGIEKGHDLERLSETLHHSEASIRAKLVSMKLYDRYLERQVDVGAVKFEAWQKLRRKIGKVVPIRDAYRVESKEASTGPDWKMAQSLATNWFDPRLELCESFHASPISKLADPRIQHKVVKHVAAFLNTAGGQVLIGFGKKGKPKGLFEDDFRTLHHYQNRLDNALQQTLGVTASPFIRTHMVRWGSEDVCIIVCEKSESEIVCVHRRYNEMMGYSKSQKLIYRRVNAMSVHDSLLVKA